MTAESVALVTGGSRGIGRAICLALAHDGHLVVPVGRDTHALAETVRMVEEAGGEAVAVVCDVRTAEAVQACVDEVFARCGQVDVLVNNAGGGGLGRPTPVDEVSDTEWEDVLQSNLSSAFYFCRAVLPSMRARRSGCILNVASVAARQASNLSGLAYTVAKSGMAGMTRYLAREVGPENIRVNTVAPGLILSERVAAKITDLTEKERDAILIRIPLKRFGQMDEIASTVAFLSSSAAAYIHGAIIDVNGGIFMT